MCCLTERGLSEVSVLRGHFGAVSVCTCHREGSLWLVSEISDRSLGEDNGESVKPGEVSGGIVLCGAKRSLGGSL